MPEVYLKLTDYKRLISLLSQLFKERKPNREDKKLLAKLEVLHDAESDESEGDEAFKEIFKKDD